MRNTKRLTPVFKYKYIIDKENLSRLNNLTDNVFADYSKVLVIRMDFYTGCNSESNNYDYMNEAFIRLRNNQRFNKIFEHYISYAAKLEYADDRKWHFHVVYFFDGQRVKNDYLLAKQIGDYWVNTITRGEGQYYSANMNPQRYDTFSVGMINYYDTAAIEALKACVSYLAKEPEQGAASIRTDAAGKAYRSYRQGNYVPKRHRLGRPRLY